MLIYIYLSISIQTYIYPLTPPALPLLASYVHLDPFGSCVPFLDAALSRAPHRSILSLTATDTSVLFANYPTATLRNYVSNLLRPSYNEGFFIPLRSSSLCMVTCTTSG